MKINKLNILFALFFILQMLVSVVTCFGQTRHTKQKTQNLEQGISFLNT